MSEQNFDKLLNEVLHQDTQVEPLSGIEQRILARLEREPARRSAWRWIAWGAPAAALATCLVALAVWPHRNIPQQTQQLATSAPQNSPTQAPWPTPNIVRQTEIGRPPAQARIAKTETPQKENLPKLDVFPTPSPIAEPVRVLAAITLPQGVATDLAESPAEQTPPAELRVEPITIAQIEIAPLFPLPDVKGRSQIEHTGEGR
jgi:hypothetical protein